MLIRHDHGVVTLASFGHDYPELIQYVVGVGHSRSSRLGDMKEITDFRLKLNYPRACLAGRKAMSDAFAYEELTQLLAGEYHEDRLRALVPRAADLLSAPTAYGPRVHSQLPVVADELANENSRRAVVYVGRPNDLGVLRDPDEAVSRAGEMPCTCLWQFHLRDGVLDMSVYMRSWDLVWGATYDVPSFVAVQLAVADHLGCATGCYTHTVGSAHVYKRHWALDTWRRSDELDIGHLLRGTIAATQEAAREALTR